MTYSEALAYLYDRLPVFHRVGVSAYKPSLTNVLAHCESIGNPQHRFRSIHVAGTNGKGSTSHMLASIYQSAGYRVGLYTSPHLKSFTERIRLNGQPMPEGDVARFVSEQREQIEAIQPSFFEVTVAMAFDFFARERVDIAIVEVGLGGRLDSTNIITPLVSVITNIGWDHTDVLGDTLPLIAAEKGGIIKPNVPVVIGEILPETLPVFAQLAAQYTAQMYLAEARWQLTDEGLHGGFRQIRCRSLTDDVDFRVELPLTGLYQVANLRTVLSTVAVAQPYLPLSWEAVSEGVRLVVAQTGLKGRFQWLQTDPIIITDTAHNKPGIQALVDTVQTIPHRHLHLVVGFVRDKDVPALLALFPDDASYYFCQANSPRALPVVDLVAQAAVLGRVGEGYPDVNLALESAKLVAVTADLILITGSTYVVAEVNQV